MWKYVKYPIKFIYCNVINILSMQCILMSIINIIYENVKTV